ncbi:MAG: hypothetical protein KIT09_06215 [Bryobacteraceae bacterium]|nr:hypothetical protein [Bryobacteraceae bacterium]
MGVLIRVGKNKAILRRGMWLAADARLEAMLNARTASWIAQTGGPPLQAEDHESSVADEVARQVGGRVLRRVPSLTSARTYIRMRQLRLDFS